MWCICGAEGVTASRIRRLVCMGIACLWPDDGDTPSRSACREESAGGAISEPHVNFMRIVRCDAG